MECRDVGAGCSAGTGLLPALLVLGMAFLSAQWVPGAEAPAIGASSRIRWEPFPIVSQWGPPVLMAELGRFRVPENRSSGSSRQIELAFVRITSVAERPGPPIVWLSGGPGGSGTGDLQTPALRLFLELRKLGDVIVLDQRGTGSSSPRLDCPGAFQFPRDIPVDRALALRALEAAARACAEKWRIAGADLSSYNTQESAEDVEDLRVALGAARLRVLAGSYGTHLALAAIRAHESSFDRAVLVGVVGPDHLRRLPDDLDDQLARIAQLAARDAGPGSREADLVAVIRRVRERLAARPAAVEIETRAEPRRTIVVSAFDLAWYVRAVLTSREGIAHAAAFFMAMDDGDFAELANFADGWRNSSAPSAAIFTQRCASAASVERELRIAEQRASAALGDATDLAEESVCRAWGILPLPAGFRDPVISAIPALFVSGSLDGDAPESNAVEVVRGFANGKLLRVDGAAHALLGFEDAGTRDAIVRFMAGLPLRGARVSLPALAFERRMPGRRGPLVAAGALALPSPFGAVR